MCIASYTSESVQQYFAFSYLMQAKKRDCAKTDPKTYLAESQNVSLPQEFLIFRQYCMSLYRRNSNR
jgi:hypothetical protein